MNKISGETIARTIVLALALINQLLATFGKGTLDIAENDVYQGVSIIFTIVSTVAAWWKNNSFTTAAIEADKVMTRIKESNPEDESIDMTK